MHRSQPNPMRIAPFLAILSLATISYSAFGGDWPQLLGPHRNGHAPDEHLSDDWTSVGPSRQWTIKIGQGYAGPVVVGNRVMIFHRKNDLEVLSCVSAQRGAELWTAHWPATYRGRIDNDHGPRCAPLILDDRIVVFGARGDLHCVALKDGAKLWSRKLAREHKADDGYFGFGSSPICLGNVLMANVGGKDACIVAVDVGTGETLWTSFDDTASYSAPTTLAADRAGTIAVFVTNLYFVGMRPTDGKLLFKLPFGARGPTVNAATPILVGDKRVFLTSSYGIGAKCVDLQDPSEPAVVWQSDDVLSSQYPTPVFYAGHLYGVHGRDDGPAASLRCVDAATGKVRWSKPGVGMAHLIVADGRLLSLSASGKLTLIRPSASEHDELGSVRVANTTVRAHPALSNGRLYVRETGEVSAWQLPQ